jgi:hypothetical protein
LALAQLLFPLQWQGLLIPVLPNSMLDVCHPTSRVFFALFVIQRVLLLVMQTLYAPVPFIVGIVSLSQMQQCEVGMHSLE